MPSSPSFTEELGDDAGEQDGNRRSRGAPAEVQDTCEGAGCRNVRVQRLGAREDSRTSSRLPRSWRLQDEAGPQARDRAWECVYGELRKEACVDA